MLVTAPVGSRERAIQDLNRKIKESGGTPSTNPDYVRVTTYKRRASSGSRAAAVQDLEVKRKVEEAKAKETTAKAAATPEKPEALKFGNVKIENPNSQGKILTVTPKESKQNLGTAPVWVVQSKNTPKGMIEAVDVEARYTNTPASYKRSSNYGISAGQREFGTTNLLINKEAYDAEVAYRKQAQKSVNAFKENPKAFQGAKGVKAESLTVWDNGNKTQTISYTLTPEYFKGLPAYKNIEQRKSMVNEKGFLKPEVYKNYVGKAKLLNRDLGQFESSSLKVAEKDYAIINTAQNIGYGIAEYGASIGGRQGTIEQIKGGIKLPRPQILKNVRSTPTVQTSVKFFDNPIKWTKETVTTRPAVTYPVVAVAGIGTLTASTTAKNIKSFGLKTGVIETTKYFSPLRIGQTTFQPNIAKELKTTTGVGKEYQLGDYALSKTKYVQDIGTLSGGSGKIKLTNYQLTKTLSDGSSVGFGSTSVKTPAYQYIGGNLKKVNLKYNFVTEFTAKPYGQGYKISSMTRDQFGNFRAGESVGFRQDFDVNTKTSIYRTASVKQSTTATLIDKGKGFYDKGAYIDFTNTYKPLTKSVGASFRVSDAPSQSFSIKSGIIPKTSYSSFGSQVSATAPKIKAASTPKGYTSPVIDTTAINSISKTSLIPKVTTSLLPRTAVAAVSIPKLTTAAVTASTTKPVLATKISTVSFPTLSTAVATAPAVSSAFKPAITQMTGLKTATTSIYARPSTVTPAITTPSFTPPSIPLIPFIPPFLIGGGFGLAAGTRSFKAKGGYGYTPSYTAVVKGIKGIAPKKKFFTGFELRPITKGWGLKRIKF